jgi:hypothetical protein
MGKIYYTCSYYRTFDLYSQKSLLLSGWFLRHILLPIITTLLIPSTAESTCNESQLSPQPEARAMSAAIVYSYYHQTKP